MAAKKDIPTVIGQTRLEETVLKITKEIVIKFIEMGKVTPATFEETFNAVYRAVKNVTQEETMKLM